VDGDATLRNLHEILDVHAELTGHAHSGLDRENHTRDELGVEFGTEHRRLMHGQPDPVPGVAGS